MNEDQTTKKEQSNGLYADSKSLDRTKDQIQEEAQQNSMLDEEIMYLETLNQGLDQLGNSARDLALTIKGRVALAKQAAGRTVNSIQDRVYQRGKGALLNANKSLQKLYYHFDVDNKQDIYPEDYEEFYKPDPSFDVNSAQYRTNQSLHANRDEVDINIAPGVDSDMIQKVLDTVPLPEDLSSITFRGASVTTSQGPRDGLYHEEKSAIEIGNIHNQSGSRLVETLFHEIKHHLQHKAAGSEEFVRFGTYEAHTRNMDHGDRVYEQEANWFAQQGVDAVDELDITPKRSDGQYGGVFETVTIADSQYKRSTRALVSDQSAFDYSAPAPPSLADDFKVLQNSNIFPETKGYYEPSDFENPDSIQKAIQQNDALANPELFLRVAYTDNREQKQKVIRDVASEVGVSVDQNTFRVRADIIETASGEQKHVGSLHQPGSFLYDRVQNEMNNKVDVELDTLLDAIKKAKKAGRDHVTFDDQTVKEIYDGRGFESFIDVLDHIGTDHLVKSAKHIDTMPGDLTPLTLAAAAKKLAGVYDQAKRDQVHKCQTIPYKKRKEKIKQFVHQLAKRLE